MSREFKIIAARVANADGTAWVMDTEDEGQVAVTLAKGKAEKLAAMEAWVAAGGVIQPWVEPSAPPAKRDLEAELDQLRTRLAALEAKQPAPVVVPQ